MPKETMVINEFTIDLFHVKTCVPFLNNITGFLKAEKSQQKIGEITVIGKRTVYGTLYGTLKEENYLKEKELSPFDISLFTTHPETLQAYTADALGCMIIKHRTEGKETYIDFLCQCFINWKLINNSRIVISFDESMTKIGPNLNNDEFKNTAENYCNKSIIKHEDHKKDYLK